MPITKTAGRNVAFKAAGGSERIIYVLCIKVSLCRYLTLIMIVISRDESRDINDKDFIRRLKAAYTLD